MRAFLQGCSYVLFFIGVAMVSVACSGPEKLGTVDMERPKERKLMPRFKLEKVELAGDGLELRQVKKLLRMRMSMFRWCYESFL